MHLPQLNLTPAPLLKGEGVKRVRFFVLNPLLNKERAKGEVLCFVFFVFCIKINEWLMKKVVAQIVFLILLKRE